MSVIGYGTYESLSWDIMEPISYVISLANMTAGFAWYAIFVYDSSKQTPPEWYREHYKQKKLSKFLETLKKDKGELIDPEQLHKDVKFLSKRMKKHQFN